MTIRSGLIVLIRCFAVLGLFQTILYAISLAGIRNPEFAATAALIIVFVLGAIVIVLTLLYRFAGTIVDIMTPKSNEIYPETALRTDDLQAIAFSTLGAYILYLALCDTMGVLGTLRTMPDLDLDIARFVATPIVSWIVGLYLLVGAPAVRSWIGRLRRSGQNRD